MTFSRGGELDVTSDDRSFRFGIYAAQAESEGSWSLMHGAALAHTRVLSVLDHRNVQPARCFQRLTHNPVSKDWAAIICHANRTSFYQRLEICEAFAVAPHRCSRYRTNFDHSTSFWSLHPAGDLRRVIYRCRIRHCADGRKSTGGCCRGSGGNGLFVALAWLAQVNVKIDKSGSYEQTTRL